MIAKIRKSLLLFAIAFSFVIVSGCIAWGTKQPEIFRIPANYDIPNNGTGTHLATTPNSPQFRIPIDCTLGTDCYIMHYVDRDPGPGVVDFGCGRQTYDTHKGTDFGIADERVMAEGVAVVAAAGGRVLRVRDGMSDRLIQADADKAAVEDIECGNGLVISHGNQWETQYCHLRNGSIAVQPGTEVEKGTVLGLVGASGLTSFPHVHLSIRYQGEIVDPFVGPTAESGCNVPRHSLWENPLDYVPTGAIRAGFASQPPKMNELWAGKFYDEVLPQDIPLIVFWVQAYGTLAGDRVHFKLTAPNGQVMVDNHQTLAESNRSWMGYVGKRNTPERPIIPGVWRGEYQLQRGDRILISRSQTINII